MVELGNGKAAEAGTLRVSVIIPVLNEEAVIGRCLDALAQSTLSRKSLEVLVVDNGSTDRTLKVVAGFSERLRLRVLQKAGVNISALRNLAAAEARGEILAFLDADCLASPEWLERALAHLDGQSERIVGSRYAIPADSSWVGRAWYGIGHAPVDGDVAYVPSGDLLIRRSTFCQLGGFNEALATSEDCEFCLRARNAGLPVRAAVELAVTHLGTPQTLAQFYRKHRWHGTHVARVFAKNRKSGAHLRAVAFALYTLGCCGAGLAGLAMALFFRQYILLIMASSGMIAVSLGCGIRKLRGVRGREFWSNLLPFTALYIVYGLARASALLAAGRGSRTETPGTGTGL